MIERIAYPAQLSATFVNALKRAAEDPAVEGIILELAQENQHSDEELEVLLNGDGVIDPLRETLRLLETQPKPLVALVHGPLSGLAFEVSLACHLRFVVDSAIGFQWPWLDLGLLPALGTGRRLAHIVGLEKAVEVLLLGKRLESADITPDRGSHELAGNGAGAAENRIKAHPKPTQPWDDADITRSPLYSQTTSNRAILQRAYVQLRKRIPAEDSSGSLLLQAFHDGLERSFLAALRIERAAFQKARAAASTKNRIYVQRELRKQAVRRATSQPGTVNVLGVLGAGLMGTGIALNALLSGRHVVLFDIDPEAAKRSSRRIEKVAGQHSTDMLTRLQTTVQLDDLARCDFVVEAVFERFDVKTDLLRKLGSILPKETILASNTTTIPISDLAAATPDPSQFIGAHFFAPVEQMELLEIIVGRQTSEATLNRALGLAQALGKTPIVVKDGPGFYTSRVVMAYVQEALLLLAEGASPTLIDQCARNAGMTIGPLAMADLTSLELLADIFRTLLKHGRGAAAESGRTLETLSRFVSAGRSGRKAGGGIYDYPAPNEKQECPELAIWFPRAPKPEAEITERLFYIQSVETLHTLKEGIIGDPGTADLASVLGWRYPVFRGGVMRYLEDTGKDQFEATRSRLEAKFGPRFRLP